MIDEIAIGKVYDSRLMARLLGYLRPYRAWTAASVVLLIVHSLLGVSGPYFTKVAVDRYLKPQPGATSLLDPWLPVEQFAGLQAVALLYLAVLVCGFLSRGLQIYIMNYTGQRVMQDLRIEIYRHLQKMGVAFYDRAAVGRLVTRVTTDVDVLNEMFTSGVVAIAGDLITLLFILSVMIHLSPLLTAALFAVGPLVLLVSIWFRKKARQSYRQVRTAIAKINAYLQEQFTGIAVVQLFNHERRSWLQFDELNAEHRDAQREAIRAHAYFFPAVEWLGVVGVAVLLVYGGQLVLQNALTLGIVVAFLQYGTRVFRPLQDLSEKYNVLQAAMASSERIFKLLDTPADEHWAEFEDQPRQADREEKQAPAEPPATRRQLEGAAAVAGTLDMPVEFREVWFAYQDEEWVLRDVSFAIAPGEMLAIVGHTGAGKTSLINLLLRFYDVQRGSVLVGGRDIRQWPLHELRRQFGVVLQDPYLFSGTVESNIRLGNAEIADERIAQVTREVNLNGFLDALPLGLQEPIQERGASLSSGQKQLVGFARALAHNPHFVILDEATSSVDTETEFKIREALARMVSGQTSIVIAHRLSTIKRADRILVLHKGRVREIGTHEDLLARQGIYWRLYQLQYRDQEATESGESAPSDRGPRSKPPGRQASTPRAPLRPVRSQLDGPPMGPSEALETVAGEPSSSPAGEQPNNEHGALVAPQATEQPSFEKRSELQPTPPAPPAPGPNATLAGVPQEQLQLGLEDARPAKAAAKTKEPGGAAGAKPSPRRKRNRKSRGRRR